MKFFSISSDKPITPFSSVILLSVVFILTSVSYANTPTDSLNKDSQKYLSIYETVDGESVHWEANFYGDEITSIYKNGKQIPEELVEDYKDKIYNELDDMRFGGKKFSFRMPVIVGSDINFDMKDLQKELEEMQKNLPKLDKQFKIYEFNDEDFKKQMDELKKELEENKSNIHKFKWNDEEFKKQMEELKKELKENLIKPEDFNFYFKEEEDSET
jgi:peptidoglycan hydrolase CwlO-like protein